MKKSTAIVLTMCIMCGIFGWTLRNVAISLVGVAASELVSWSLKWWK